MKISLVILLGLLSGLSFGQEVDLSGPRATMKSFLTAMKRVKEGDKSGYQDAIETLNLDSYDPSTRETSGRLAAERLIKTIDRIRYVRYSEIPEAPQSGKWIFQKEQIYINGQVVNVEIAIRQQKDKRWLFSSDTLAKIELYEKFTRKRKNVEGALAFQTWRSALKDAMPAWTGKRSFILLNGQWLALLLIIFLGLLVKKLVQNFVLKFIQKKFQRIDYRQVTEKTRNRFNLAVGVCVYSVIWLFGIRFLELRDQTLAVLHRGGLIVFALSIVWCGHHLVDILASYFAQLAEKTENKFDDLLIPLLRKSAKVFIACVGGVYIAHSFTINITNLLAGLGIGGLAFALAAKDTLSNLFGSLTVILDRPFQIGDWVTIGDSIEGVVEEVGFRSTRIRTFYTSLVTLPNNQLTNTAIDNYGKRTYRRYSTSVGVQYDTDPKQIEAFCEGIRRLIVEDPNTRKDYFNVYLKGFGASSIDIMIYMFWDVSDYTEELAAKHTFLMNILRLAAELKVDFAFPTQTLHMFNEQKQNKEFPFGEDNFHASGSDKAIGLAKNPISFQKPRSDHKAF